MPSAVGELAERVPVSRPAVSQHLKVFEDAGLVTDERACARRIYRVNPDGLNQMRSELEAFWSDTLIAYKKAVEQPADPPGSKATTASSPDGARNPAGGQP